MLEPGKGQVGCGGVVTPSSGQDFLYVLGRPVLSMVRTFSIHRAGAEDRKPLCLFYQ